MILSWIFMLKTNDFYCVGHNIVWSRADRTRIAAEKILFQWQAFYRIGPMSRYGLVVGMSMYLYMQFSKGSKGGPRGAKPPLIGPQIIWSDHGLSLVPPPPRLVEVLSIDSDKSCPPTRKSPKNKDLFRIAYMDRPRVGTRKSLVDQLGRAQKQGVVPDCIHGFSMRGMCSTGGLVHSSTNS